MDQTESRAGEILTETRDMLRQAGCKRPKLSAIAAMLAQRCACLEETALSIHTQTGLGFARTAFREKCQQKVNKEAADAAAEKGEG